MSLSRDNDVAYSGATSRSKQHTHVQDMECGRENENGAFNSFKFMHYFEFDSVKDAKKHLRPLYTLRGKKYFVYSELLRPRGGKNHK